MEIGQIIKERYEIIQLLGEGGMSYVYKAIDKQLQRTVAIKTLKPIYVEQEKFVERFKREAQTAANLNHPNIVQIFDWGIGDEPFFVMEFIEGNTLNSIISSRGTILLPYLYRTITVCVYRYFLYSYGSYVPHRMLCHSD